MKRTGCWGYFEWSWCETGWCQAENWSSCWGAEGRGPSSVSQSLHSRWVHSYHTYACKLPSSSPGHSIAHPSHCSALFVGLAPCTMKVLHLVPNVAAHMWSWISSKGQMSLHWLFTTTGYSTAPWNEFKSLVLVSSATPGPFLWNSVILPYTCCLLQRRSQRDCHCISSKCDIGTSSQIMSKQGRPSLSSGIFWSLEGEHLFNRCRT